MRSIPGAILGAIFVSVFLLTNTIGFSLDKIISFSNGVTTLFFSIASIVGKSKAKGFKGLFFR